MVVMVVMVMVMVMVMVVMMMMLMVMAMAMVMVMVMSHLITESLGHSMKTGGHPLNAGNFNDTINRQYTHGYFKPRFAEWPTGGYTRKETLHRVRSGLLDTSP